jgi:outer membrane immunogenic protein
LQKYNILRDSLCYTFSLITSKRTYAGKFMNMKTSTLAIAFVSVCATGSLVSAADLPLKAPPFAAPPAPSSWGGCYVGVNGGGAFAGTSDYVTGTGSSNATSTNNGVTVAAPGTTQAGLPGTDFSHSVSGGIVGGQVGCQYQWGAFVFGLEGSGDWANVNGSTTVSFVNPASFLASDGFSSRLNWLATATPRLGYAWTNWLFYAKGGLAAGQDDVTFTRLNGSQAGDFFSVRESRVGYTVGAGIEWMFTPIWILGVEYNYVNFGRTSVGGYAATPAGGLTEAFWAENHALNFSDVLARLSYKF